MRARDAEAGIDRVALVRIYSCASGQGLRRTKRAGPVDDRLAFELGVRPDKESSPDVQNGVRLRREAATSRRDVKARWNSKILAESEQTIEAGGYHYFPRAAV